ncbi:T9SS type A sorting domain-containing protein [candidate division TA06 bacterium]|uniref:T9SS type A sorting domain-containing protein n=1 Tax=candidate division TA06 bacterium TaxID=2250710 RepID=A0A523UUQ5_UNCT6|nr:MAG: T9SS type A sorting domain-containing protein [candidate division TA06 bacterium]
MRLISIGLILIAFFFCNGAVLADDYSRGYVPGEMLVCFTKEANERISLRDSGGFVSVGIPSVDELNMTYQVYDGKRLIWWDKNMSEAAKEHGLDRIYYLHLPKDSDIEVIVAQYEKDPNVEYATPNTVYRTHVVPNDPRYGTQWGLKKIMAAEGWDISKGDSSAITGFIDSAVDWTHEDLHDGLWINAEEDLNGNGVFDTFPDGNGGDLNFYDDDGNGFIDDVIGWDFISWDWDPTPDVMEGSQHGTSTYGISNAVTDNAVGVSGLAWECVGMAFRCGSGLSIFTAQAIQAMYYAVGNGAHVLNNSWGGYSPNSNVNAVVQFAHSQNLVIVASAGNDNSQAIHYPSGYANVIAVAATDANDRKSSYSNYGTWVDCCAPGDGIVTTTWHNGYESIYGTSASAPFVTGLVALVRGQHPGWTNTQIENQILSHCGCDSIDHLNPGYEGKLGWGRINVFKTLGTSVKSYVHMIGDITVLDGGTGDGDGRPEKGERDSLVIWLKNEECWLNALSVQATLATSDTGIYMVDATVIFPSLANGDSANNSSMPFVFDVSPGFDPHRVTFHVTINTSPSSYHTEDTFNLMVGHPSVLLVDDDGGAGYEPFFEEALDQISVAFDEWELFSQGDVGGVLANYCLVIWFTGDQVDSTLAAQDQTDLQTYLDAGGLLFITGQNIGQDIGSDPFYANYLHASFDLPTTNDKLLYGVTGDEIGDGLTLLTAGSPGAGNQTSQDIISPLAGADSVIMYGPADCAAIKYDSGTYKVVYFGFGFEGIASRPAQGFDNNWLVMREIIKWLGCPQVGVEEEVEVRAPISRTHLFQITPNPFSKATTIEFTLGGEARRGKTKLGLYDAAGRLVETLMDGFSQPKFSMSFDASLLPSGVYFLRLDTPEESLCRKMVIVK